MAAWLNNHKISCSNICPCLIISLAFISSSRGLSCSCDRCPGVQGLTGGSRGKGSEESVWRLTQPAPVQIHGHKHGRYCEEVHHWVHLQPEPQLIIGCYELEWWKEKETYILHHFKGDHILVRIMHNLDVWTLEWTISSQTLNVFVLKHNIECIERGKKMLNMKVKCMYLHAGQSRVRRTRWMPCQFVTWSPGRNSDRIL